MWWVTLGELLESKMESNRRVKTLVEYIGKIANYKHMPIVFAVFVFAAVLAATIWTCGGQQTHWATFGIRR